MVQFWVGNTIPILYRPALHTTTPITHHHARPHNSTSHHTKPHYTASPIGANGNDVNAITVIVSRYFRHEMAAAVTFFDVAPRLRYSKKKKKKKVPFLSFANYSNQTKKKTYIRFLFHFSGLPFFLFILFLVSWSSPPKFSPSLSSHTVQRLSRKKNLVA